MHELQSPHYRRKPDTEMSPKEVLDAFGIYNVGEFLEYAGISRYYFNKWCGRHPNAIILMMEGAVALGIPEKLSSTKNERYYIDAWEDRYGSL